MDAEQSRVAYAGHALVEGTTTTTHDVALTDAASVGMAFDGEHLGANRRASRGTSWYDLFIISADRVVVTVGDRGVDGGAATFVTRRLRETLTRLDAGSIATTDLLREASLLFADLPSAESTTALVGVIDIGARRFSYISASPAPPFVRYADGTVRALPADVTSVAGRQPLASTVVDLTGAAYLVLSTAGFVHTADRAAAGDANRLRRLVGDERLAHSVRPAAWLTRAALADASHNDVAMLVVTFPATRESVPAGESPAWTSSWSFEATAASTQAARRAFLTHLQSKADHAATIDYSAAELIFGELLGNVVRHAPGRVEVRLDYTRDVPVLHVLDDGPGFQSRRRQERLPDDDLSESGRGLFIISACAASFTMQNRECGGTHAMATLSLNAENRVEPR